MQLLLAMSVQTIVCKPDSKVDIYIYIYIPDKNANFPQDGILKKQRVHLHYFTAIRISIGLGIWETFFFQMTIMARRVTEEQLLFWRKLGSRKHHTNYKLKQISE